MLDDCRIALRKPVALGIAGRRCDDNKRRIPGNVRFNPGLISLGNRNMPLGLKWWDAQGMGKALEPFQYVGPGGHGDASVDDQTMELLGEMPWKAPFLAGWNPGGEEVGPERQLHVEQDIKATPQLTPYRRECAETFTFIEYNNPDAGQVRYQTGLGFTHKPGNLVIRELVLYGLNRCYGVTDVTNGREAENTESASWWFHGRHLNAPDGGRWSLNICHTSDLMGYGQ